MWAQVAKAVDVVVGQVDTAQPAADGVAAAASAVVQGLQTARKSKMTSGINSPS